MIITTATNRKVREILKDVRNGSLIPRPEFQRRLVWTSKDKDKFIESVVKGYPFPEIYICNGQVDTITGEGTQLLVDGLQRINTLKEYFEGENSFAHVLTAPYSNLDKSDKEKFLEYSIVVRDLGNLTKEQIIDVFQRLNSTQYTLRDMEVNNAIYDGAMKKFCEKISEDIFFEQHKIFSVSDRKRMNDIAYCLTLVGTMMLGYFNRDNEHENILDNYNESFPDESIYEKRINKTLDFINECGFLERSRIWKKADFLSAFIELDNKINIESAPIEPIFVLEKLTEFYENVDKRTESMLSIYNIYQKSAVQASNDRNNRIRRGFIIQGIINQESEESIISNLKQYSLI